MKLDTVLWTKHKKVLLARNMIHCFIIPVIVLLYILSESEKRNVPSSTEFYHEVAAFLKKITVCLIILKKEMTVSSFYNCLKLNQQRAL